MTPTILPDLHYGNLLKSLEESSPKQLPKEEVGHILELIMALTDDRDFWNHNLDGLAVLGVKGILHVCKLQRPVAKLSATPANLVGLAELVEEFGNARCQDPGDDDLAQGVCGWAGGHSADRSPASNSRSNQLRDR